MVFSDVGMFFLEFLARFFRILGVFFGISFFRIVVRFSYFFGNVLWVLRIRNAFSCFVVCVVCFYGHVFVFLWACVLVLWECF